MGRFNKKFILILLLIGIFLLTGCNKFKLSTYDASKEGVTPKITIAPDDMQGSLSSAKTDPNASNTVTGTLSDPSASSTGETLTTPIAIAPAANIELSVYTVNADTAAVEPVTALIPDGSEITPQLIADTVIDALADQSIIIEYDSISTKDDAVIVSFKKDKAPYSNLGSGFEGSILDALAQSLIDNLPDYKKVIYQIEGKAYQSGIYEYLIDEPHLEVN